MLVGQLDLKVMIKVVTVVFHPRGIAPMKFKTFFDAYFRLC